MSPSGYIKAAWCLMTKDLGVLLGGFLVANLLSFIVGSFIPVLGSLVFWGPAMVGKMYVALRAIRNQPYDFNDLFKGLDVFSEAILTGLLVAIIHAFAIGMCCLPYIFLAPFFFYPFAFVIDKNMKAMDAIKASWNLVSQDYGRHFALFLLIGLLNLLGFLFCCVGLVFTSVLGTISLAVAYNDLVPCTEVPPYEQLASEDPL